MNPTSAPRAVTGGVLCLLPVRNGGAALGEWLAAAPAWCDGVLALDDGSTDDTRAVLEASPVVVEVLTHPVRPTTAGWDDGANRAELLSAAARHRPAWILWLDADERLAADDAAALRAFIDSDALPGVAYGLRHCRMWGDDAYDPRTPWVYRLFAWRAEHTLATDWLHFNPVPEQIPQRAWVRTSIRMQHFGAADDAAIEARMQKYDDADPFGEFPIDFGGMDAAPQRVVSWIARDASEPVVLGPEAAFGPSAIVDDIGRSIADDDRPLLAVLLPVRNGEDDLDDWFSAVEPLADLVVALDDGSTDGTRSVLAAHPLVGTLLGRPVRPDYRGWDDAGNRQALLDAVGEFRPRWVLFLDADERTTPAGVAEMARLVADPGDRVGYFLCGRNYFLGRWIRHCQLYPSWQLRLLRVGRVRYRKEGHGQREVADGPLGHVREPYDHLNVSKGIADWISRHNHYSTAEIELVARLRGEPLAPGDLFTLDGVRRRRFLKRLLARVGCRPAIQFVYTYLLRGGFLDGYPGFVYCLLRCAHEMHITAKLAESAAFQRGVPPDHGPPARGGVPDRRGAGPRSAGEPRG